MFSKTWNFAEYDDGAIAEQEGWENYTDRGEVGAIPGAVISGGYLVAAMVGDEGTAASNFDDVTAFPLHSDFDMTIVFKGNQTSTGIAAIAICLGEPESHFFKPVEIFTNGNGANSFTLSTGFSTSTPPDVGDTANVSLAYDADQTIVCKRRGMTFSVEENGVEVISVTPDSFVASEQRISVETYVESGASMALKSITLARVEDTTGDRTFLPAAIEAKAGTFTPTADEDILTALSADDASVMQASQVTVNPNITLILDSTTTPLPPTAIINQEALTLTDWSFTTTTTAASNFTAFGVGTEHVVDSHNTETTTTGTDTFTDTDTFAGNDVFGVDLVSLVFLATTGVTTNSKTFAVDKLHAVYSFTLDIPDAPVLSAEASGTSVNLSWTVDPASITGFTIEWSSNEAFLGESEYAAPDYGSATPAAGATTHTVSGLNPETTYYFRIRATNESGDSDNSTAVSATTAAASANPRLSNALGLGL